MKDLLEAIKIFLKYDNPYSPFHCEHDTLTVDIDPAIVSEGDRDRLEELGFHSFEGDDCFTSFRFGSC